MQKNLDAGPEIFATLEHQYRFCRERRKGRQPPQKTGNDKQSPFRTQVVVSEKEGCRHADDETTDQIGDQRTQWNVLVYVIHPHSQTPS